MNRIRGRAALLPALAIALLAAGCAARGGDVGTTERNQPEIMGRASWGAEEPILSMSRHEIERITIHHTAFLQEQDQTLAEKMRWLQDFSQNEAPLDEDRVRAPWADIPYHFFIAHDGRVAEARPVEYAGDTNTNYDPTGHLLIVLEGNFEEEEPTAAQLETLRRLVRYETRRRGIPAERIQSHRDYADTLCPCPYLTELRALVAAEARP